MTSSCIAFQSMNAQQTVAALAEELSMAESHYRYPAMGKRPESTTSLLETGSSALFV